MKFRTMKAADLRRTMAAIVKVAEIKNVEKEVVEKTSFDAFWTVLWTYLGCFILGFNHRSLMECYVLQDKATAKLTLQKIFIEIATSIRCSTQWSGYQNYLHSMWLVNNYHADQGATLVILLERALLALKREDESALVEVLKSLHILLEKDDSCWWDAYFDKWTAEEGSTWASYSQEYLEDPIKLESPQFDEISFYSEGMENWEYILPQDVYIDMKAFKRLLNEGLRLSEPQKVIGKKLP